jgi:hypothetical protein
MSDLLVGCLAMVCLFVGIFMGIILTEGNAKIEAERMAEAMFLKGIVKGDWVRRKP